MCCSIPNDLPEKEDQREIRQIRRVIEFYEKTRKEISDIFQKLEVERKKIDERLGKLWHEFRRKLTKSSSHNDRKPEDASFIGR
jgi:septal ring factor EnvC (AmiA/AmiB activator)